MSPDETSTGLGMPHVSRQPYCPALRQRGANSEAVAPIAAAVEFTIAGAGILAVLLGAIGGVVLWKMRINLLLGVPAVAAVYVVVLILSSGLFWLRLSLAAGLLPLIQAALLSHLLATFLQTRAKLRSVWSALAALASSLVVGFLTLLPVRLDLWTSNWLAVGIIACIFVLSFTVRKSVSR